MLFSNNQRIIWAISTVSYALFFIWYGTGGNPISVEEAVELLTSSGLSEELARDTAGWILPRDDDDGRSFLMLNLVKQREFPDYGVRPDLKPAWVKSGADADQNYAMQFVPKILKRACHPVFVSWTVAALPIMFPGDDQADDETRKAFSNWDYFALFRYRSFRDLLTAIAELTNELGNDAMMVLKHSGVERTYVIPIYSTGFSIFVLASVGLAMIIITQKIVNAMSA